jgi:hypothetical protein
VRRSPTHQLPAIRRRGRRHRPVNRRQRAAHPGIRLELLRRRVDHCSRRHRRTRAARPACPTRASPTRPTCAGASPTCPHSPAMCSSSDRLTEAAPTRAITGTVHPGTAPGTLYRTWSVSRRRPAPPTGPKTW